MLQDERGTENGREGGRKAPKMVETPSSSSPLHRRSPSGSSRGPRPPPTAWEGSEGRHDQYYPQHPPPQQQQPQQEHQAANQRPHSYSDPYVYSRSNPRGAAGGDRSAPPAAASGGGGRRGTAGRGSSGGRPPRLADDQGDEGVFPHYAAPAGAGRLDERRSGGTHGGAPTPVWSRHEPQHPHGPPPRLHPVRDDGPVAVDAQVVAPSRAVAGAATIPAAASAAAATERGGRGGGTTRAGAGGDYYDHPFYQRERELRGEGGMVRGVRGGRGRGRGGGGRMPYADAGPPPFSRPPHGVVDRADRPVGVGRNGAGGGGHPRSPVHMAVRGGSRGHPMGPSDRGDPLPSRYVRPAQPGITQALCEAVERIFQHRKKRAGGGGGGRAPEDPDTDIERSAGAGSSPALDAKKATMRIIAILESFDGRLNDMMADPRAMAELDAIFPGVEEREFRALLEGCIERSQVSLFYCSSLFT